MTTEYDRIKKFITNDIIGQKLATTFINSTFKFNEATGDIDSSHNSVASVDTVYYYDLSLNIKRGKGIVSYSSKAGIDISSTTFIDATRKVATGLFITYINSHKNYLTPTSSASTVDLGYKFKFTEDGSVILVKNDATGKEIEMPSMTVAVKKHMLNDKPERKIVIEETCKKIFGVHDAATNNRADEFCVKHFYTILGRSAFGMLHNIEDATNSSYSAHAKIIAALKGADVGIKYEILKNLDWKMKISNGKKEMVSVDQWLERLAEDDRAVIKAQAGDFKTYLNGNPVVKDILESMINDINNNSRLLEEKYKEAVDTTKTGNLPSSRSRKRISPLQAAQLRGDVLAGNVLLNQPFMGLNGVMFAQNMHNPYQSGGAKSEQEIAFEGMKNALRSIGQTLSPETDRQMTNKINKIKELENHLTETFHKINSYTTILRKNKQYIINGQVLTLDVIDDLLNQYNIGSKNQTKQMITLYSAFGKIKMLLEKENVADLGKEKEGPYFNI
jgi:hypothetical protein